ncbi:MAG: hypothetical protein R2839_03700 [Thermomicrobiales bacterium]
MAGRGAECPRCSWQRADVVNSAEVLDLAGSALGALLEGLGDLDF